MAQDTDVESSVKENTAPNSKNDNNNNNNNNNEPATASTTTESMKDDGGNAESSFEPTTTTTATKDPYMGKYMWDTSNGKKKEKAEGVNLPSGVIADYAWSDDGNSKGVVSIYVTLKGLDKVSEEDLTLSLSENKQGLNFEIKNLEGKRRFLTIEKLNQKVKNTKLIRKKGRDQVLIKLIKEDAKRKWYNLKSGGKNYDHTLWDDDVEDDFPDDDEEDPLTAMEEDDGLVATKDTKKTTDNVADENTKKTDDAEQTKKTGDEDVTMEDSEQAKEV